MNNSEHMRRATKAIQKSGGPARIRTPASATMLNTVRVHMGVAVKTGWFPRTQCLKAQRQNLEDALV